VSIFCPPTRLNLLIRLGCLQVVSVDFLSSDSPEFAEICLQRVSVDFLSSNLPEFADPSRMLAAGEF
jgi:hypothetical protein